MLSVFSDNDVEVLLKKKKKKTVWQRKRARGINSPSLAMLQKDMQIRRFLALSYSQDKCHLSVSSFSHFLIRKLLLLERQPVKSKPQDVKPREQEQC